MKFRRRSILQALAASALVGSSNAIGQDLDTRIPVARPDTYADIRDGKDWKNPFLTFMPYGIAVRSDALPEGRVTVPLEELRGVLAALPTGAWPYGRVVVASDSSILGSLSDLEPIRRNREAALEVLEALGVRVDLWASP